ncbi:TauD/TfdA family dioxygenase [Porticoccaceae bacterium]|nr:TauD/TfdA family dioxygenase [Porticoccaceae bacterium]MDC0517045.1 TauD/TfdA family dioxygenase [Porticoccaceae bacterium]MDC0588752.1 TauD/TfdA family dioxygenase [Porticoccaceae bacterium]
MAHLNVETINLPEQQAYAASAFPLLLSAAQVAGKSAISDWIAEHRDYIEDQLALTGAILFRGFGLVNDRDFDDFIRAFDWPNFTYAESLSNAVRRNRTELVFTANEAPPTVAIFLHHEMAQTPVYPSKLFFFCEQAAESGGATPICRSDILLQQLREKLPDFVADCENKGVRYSQTMPLEEDLDSGQGRSWQSTLSAGNREQAETKLRNLNYDWQWQDDGSLSVTTPVLPAVRQLKDGRTVFFNQLIAAFRGWKDVRNSGEKSICFGDGSAIDSAHMDLAIELADELTFDIPWQSGDVAVLDNFLVMHGRRPFEGKRAVLASLVA